MWASSFCSCDPSLVQPKHGFFGVVTHDKHFLHSPRPGIKAFQPRQRWILHLKTRRRFSPADLDPSRHDARNVRALPDDKIENLIEPADTAVLAFDSADFHG